VYIFTGRYFSHNAVTSDAPRPELPPLGTLTDKQIADTAKPFLRERRDLRNQGQRDNRPTDGGAQSQLHAHWIF
jgi:hypothetical protein